MRIIVFLIAVLCNMSAIAQGTDKNKFTPLPGGVSYNIAYDAPGTVNPEVGDFVQTNMYLIVDNKVIYNSLQANGNEPISFVITESPTPTDIQEVIKLMTPGDSALINLSVDSMIKSGSPQLDWMKPETGQKATYVVKLLALRPKSTLNK